MAMFDESALLLIDKLSILLYYSILQFFINELEKNW